MENTLSSKQRKYLKAKANPLKPIIQIGKSGLSEESISSITQALEHHELVKVRFLALKAEKDQFIELIPEKTGSQFVSLIGHILTLYRQAEKEDKRKYRLPS